MRRVLPFLLVALTCAAPATDVGAAAATATGGVDAAAAEAVLARNTVVGVVALARELARLDIRTYELDAKLCAAMYRGIPERIRGYFSDAGADGAPSDFVGATLAREEDGRYRLDLRFRDDRIAKRGDARQRLGSSASKGHHATIYLSRAKVVSARIDLERIRDPRADGGATAYALIHHNRRIFSDDIAVERLAKHPWCACATAPIGLEDIQGISLQVDVTGWWKNACDIEPVTHLFAYGDAPEGHLWLAYKELSGHVDRRRGFLQVGGGAFAAGITCDAAFPAYLGLAPDADDRFSVIDLTEEGVLP